MIVLGYAWEQLRLANSTSMPFLCTVLNGNSWSARGNSSQRDCDLRMSPYRSKHTLQHLWSQTRACHNTSRHLWPWIKQTQQVSGGTMANGKAQAGARGVHCHLKPCGLVQKAKRWRLMDASLNCCNPWLDLHFTASSSIEGIAGDKRRWASQGAVQVQQRPNLKCFWHPVTPGHFCPKQPQQTDSGSWTETQV